MTTDRFEQEPDGDGLESAAAVETPGEPAESALSGLRSRRRAMASPFESSSSIQDLKGRSVRGGLLTMVGQGLMFLIQTGSTFALARILTPEDFGLQGMVVAMTGVLGLFRDVGLSIPTVQRQDLTHQQTSTLFWVNVGVGATLTVATIVAAPVLSAFYREPRLLPIAAAYAATFLLNSFAIQHRALLNRMMRFGAMSAISLLGLAGGAATGITMGLLGYGYWSLVAMAIVNPLLVALGVWAAMPWIPGRPVREAGVTSMLRMGGTVTLNSLVIYVAFNAEKVLLGRFWGAESLGFYGRAYQLANMPMDQLNTSFSTVAFPAMARVQHDPPRLVRSYLKGYSVIISVTVFLVLICALFPNQLVAVLLGPKWSASAPVLRLLTPSMLTFSLAQPFGWLLQATGRARRSLNMAFMMAPVMVGGVLLGVGYGPAGVAMGYSGAMAALIVPMLLWSMHGTGMTVFHYLRSIRQPMIAGATAGAAGWLFETLRPNMLPIYSLAAGVTLIFAVYAAILLASKEHRELFADLFAQVRNRASE